ncbi:hypothetical protein ACFL1S_05610 [Pseudomonadota bacterium]
MKKIAILILLTFLFAQPEPDFFHVDVRTRVLDGNIVQIVVQVDNNSEYTIVSLEGFITVYGSELNIVEEKRINLVKEFETAMGPGQNESRSFNFEYNRNISRKYTFHISKIKFKGDHRIYGYTPPAGLIRID